MKAVLLKNLKKGDLFTLKPIDEPKSSQVYVRDDYDRSSKKFEVYKFDDVCSYRELKGDKVVYVDFFF